MTVKEKILIEMPNRLNWGHEIFIGFLKGQSVHKRSALISGDQEFYPKKIFSYVNENDTVYSKYFKFSAEAIETILDELYNIVQSETRIVESRNWFEEYQKRAQQLKKNLEKLILYPQLP